MTRAGAEVVHGARQAATEISGITHSIDEGEDVATTCSGELFEGTILATTMGEFSQGMRRMKALGCRQHWGISSSVLQLFPDQVLGSGSFGTVILGRYHEETVAVKLAREGCTEEAVHRVNLRSLMNELRVLRYLRHTHIVLMYGACVDVVSGEIGLVFEKVAGVSFTKFVTMLHPAAWAKRKVLGGVCCALSYLHALKPAVVHGDLKDSNIMVEERLAAPHAKLLDFGLSRVLTRSARPLSGTLMWAAPEVILRTEPPSQAADVFSLGRLAYFLVAAKLPYNNDRTLIVDMAQSGVLQPLDWPRNVELGDQCKQLTDRCLTFLSKERPPIASVHQMVLNWSANGERSEESRVWHMAVCWNEGVKQIRQAREMVPWTKAGPVTIVVNALDQHMEVTEVSEGWIELCGKGIGPVMRLSDWLGPGVQSAMTKWLQRHVNAAMSSGKAFSRKFMDLRGLSQDGSAYKASLMVYFPATSFDGDDSTYLVIVGFDHIYRERSRTGKEMPTLTEDVPVFAGIGPTRMSEQEEG